MNSVSDKTVFVTTSNKSPKKTAGPVVEIQIFNNQTKGQPKNEVPRLKRKKSFSG